MSRSNDILSEREIRSLLAEDPPETLSSAQRARLRTRLGLEDQQLHPAVAPSLGVVAEHIDISVTERANAPGHRRAAWLAAAAAVVVAGLFVTVRGQATDRNETQAIDTEVVASPAVSTVERPSAASVCLGHVGPLTAAIETWDGVDNWAFLTDKRLPEPDLVELALAAISAADGIANLENAQDIERTLTELRMDVATGKQAMDPFAWTTPEREAHRVAVVAAVAEIESVIDREGWAIHEGCD